MLVVADRLGEPLVNQRPHGPDTNAVAALIIHCCGVAEFWLGHVALGLSSSRDRDAEFSRTATLIGLHQLVDEAVARSIAHIGRLEAGEGTDEGGRQFLPDSDTSDASVVVHVLEELYQHLGHIELAADALATKSGSPDTSVGPCRARKSEGRGEVEPGDRQPRGGATPF